MNTIQQIIDTTTNQIISILLEDCTDDAATATPLVSNAVSACVYYAQARIIIALRDLSDDEAPERTPVSDLGDDEAETLFVILADSGMGPSRFARRLIVSKFQMAVINTQHAATNAINSL